MSLYSAYGLVFDSDIPLPQLTPCTGLADVVIHAEQNFEIGAGAALRNGYGILNEGEIYLNWAALIGTFRIKDGREIAYLALPNIEENLLTNFIVTAVMNVLLYQRGYLLLHGSAVLINEQAVGFLGSSGKGKSTLAAAFAANGSQIIADDTLALKIDGGSVPQIYPAFPQLKLWPESIRGMGGNPEALSRLHSLQEKRASQIQELFASGPTALTRLYVLAVSDNGSSTEPCSFQAAFKELFANSYAGYLFATQGFDLLLETHGSSTHFQKCVQLLQTVPIAYLRRPLTFEALLQVVQIVQKEIVGSL